MPRGLLLLCLAMPAFAQNAGAGWGLTWSAAAECIDARQLSTAVESRLGHRVFFDPPSRTIRGTLQKQGEHYLAKLTLFDETGAARGEREVKSPEPDCRSIDSALSLVVAVMIDPSASLAKKPALADEEFSPPPSGWSPPPPPVPLPQPETTPPPDEAPKPKAKSELAFAAAAMAGFTFTPNWGGLVEWRAALTHRLRLMLRLLLSPYTAIDRGNGSNGYNFYAQLAAALGWKLVDAEPWSLTAALGLSAAPILTSSSAFGQTVSTVSVRPEVLGQLTLRRWLTPRIGLSLGATVGVAFTQTTVDVVDPSSGTLSRVILGAPASVTLDFALVVPLG